MAYAIAAVRTAVLALLDDVSSARYTSAQIDQAARQALTNYDLHRPVRRAYDFSTDGERRMALPADFSAIRITKIEVWDADPSLIYEIPFTAIKVDEQWEIDTRLTLDAGTTLTIYYSANNTIDGLDAAAGTTIDDDTLFCMGAAGYAAQSRATSRTESINLQAEVMIQLLTISQRYLTDFKAGLRAGHSQNTWAGMDMPEVRF